MSKRTLSQPQTWAELRSYLDTTLRNKYVQRIVDECQRRLNDEQDHIRRVYVQCIQFLYNLRSQGSFQSRACKLSKMRKIFPKNTLKQKNWLGKKRWQCRVPGIREMPVDFVTNIFQNASPPGCKIYRKISWGRWMVKLGKCNISRSWSKYGDIESGVLILAKAWERYMELYGLPTCPIKGLMELAKAIESNSSKRMEYSSLTAALLGKTFTTHTIAAASESSVASAWGRAISKAVSVASD